MKIKFNRPKEGDRRIRRQFLWLPMRTEDGIRWLEFVTLEEVYTIGFTLTGYDYTPQGWYVDRIIEKGKL